MSEFNHNQVLRGESITGAVNNIMRTISDNLTYKPIITSNGFRTGYVTQLWKDKDDIEFVKQIICHAKIESTSFYVENLTEK